MTKENDAPLALKIILYPILYIFFVFSSVFLEGWAGKTLWNWFVEPFVGIHITTLAAAGIGLVLSLWTYQWTAKPDKLTGKQNWSLLMHVYLNPILFVSIGYIIRYWLM